MPATNYTPITPGQVYGGLLELPDRKTTKLSEITRENKASRNSYIDLFAGTIRMHGKRAQP